MKAWTDNIDPQTIPDDVLRSERARRNSLLRTTKTGGRNGGRRPKEAAAEPDAPAPKPRRKPAKRAVS
jgi:hypothetical protein